jgi:hypothetical protein
MSLFTLYKVVSGGHYERDEMRDVNESNDGSLLNIRADGGVKHFKKGDGCIVLDYTLIFQK